MRHRLLPILLLLSAACGGRGGRGEREPDPAPGTMRVHAATGGMLELRLLRADSALELTVRPATRAGRAPAAIVPVAAPAARTIAGRLEEMVQRPGLAAQGEVRYASMPGGPALLIHGLAPPRDHASPIARAVVATPGEPEVALGLDRVAARRLAFGLRTAAEALSAPAGAGAAARGHYHPIEVDMEAAPGAGTCHPRYPVPLRDRGITGDVELEFVIDTTGRVDPGTTKVLHSTDPAFSQAVLQSLRCARFRPARVGGRAVRVLEQQHFVFDIAGRG